MELHLTQQSLTDFWYLVNILPYDNLRMGRQNAIERKRGSNLGRSELQHPSAIDIALRGGEMKNEMQAPAYVIKWKASDGVVFAPEDKTVVKFRTDLYEEILRCARNYSQKELQVLFEEPQPRVSELLHGRIAGKSLEKLMYYASRLGIEVRTSFERRTRNLEDELRLAEGDNT
jgi:predicted XRE-type DNA-binding protein